VNERASLLPFPRAPDGVELRHLRAFVAVADELSFSRAAAKLYLSQPALSRQISRLEQLVGVELVRRSTHNVELTLAGEALLARSRKLLADVDDAVSAALAVGNELVARIARLWEPLPGLISRQDDLHEVRAAVEALQAHFSPPPGIVVRHVPAGGVPALVATATPEALPTVLFLHGGAFVFGSAYGYRAHAGALAAASSTGVLVPDYRLAPEHPFPAALDDALRAYRWLLERGVAPSSIVVAGDSAGGSLALSLLLKLEQEAIAQPACAVLWCPFVNLQRQASTRSGGPLDVEDVRRCIQMYLGSHSAADPLLDPLRADLTGLPPLLVQTATGDARIDDAKALAAHAREHDVRVDLEVFAVDAHDFQLFWSFLPEAADAIQQTGAFIRANAQTRADRHDRFVG
jgi:epsilon-lactone hydrolase